MMIIIRGWEQVLEAEHSARDAKRQNLLMILKK